MRRYSEQNLSIRNIELVCPTIDQELAHKIYGWLGIALQNHVETLSLSITPGGRHSYELPAILFSAKSLISLKCCRVVVPFCKNLKLISLNPLDLSKVELDEHMLQDIIMSCPLKKLKLNECYGFQSILIPHCSSLELLDAAKSIPVGGKIVVDTSSFQCFIYCGGHKNDCCPFILKPASMKSLRKLCISRVAINANIFDQFVSELTSIEIMTFYDCLTPKNIRITSKTLKVLGIYECDELIEVAIDAPVLDTFNYTGDLKLSSVTISHEHEKCNVYLCISTRNLDTRAFVKIRKLLSTFNRCKVLDIFVNDTPQDQLSMIPDEVSCDVQELKLSLSGPIRFKSDHKALMPLLDGLFWSCRPDILSLSIALEFDNTIVKKLLEILEMKVKCWKHPLKHFEIEGPNCSSIPWSWDLHLRVRLFW